MWKPTITVVVALITFLLYRTFIVFQPDKSIFEPCSSNDDHHSLKFDADRFKTFQKLLQFQTISYDENDQNTSELIRCRDFIKTSYGTLVNEYQPYVSLIDIAEYSLLFAIQGKNSQLKPFLFSGHMDVVPAKNPTRWKYPPFDAHADDEFIFARGTLDDKGNVFTMLEALREYLKVHGQPSRTFYIAITHDEEVGRVGAMGVANYLAQQPYDSTGDFEYVLDEGTVILENAFPGLKTPSAIISVSEKGYMTVQYTVNITPGHSSIPTPPTAIGVLAKAIDRLENTPQPSKFGYGPEMSLFNAITPYLNLPLRLVMSNTWLFGPIIQQVLESKPGTNAIQRTTTAITLIVGGEKENMLPSSASVTVNHRIHTADSCHEVLENNRRIINDDRVTAHVKRCVEPSPISPHGRSVFAYRILEQTIRQTFDKDRQGIIVVPGLMLGATDSRSYTNLSKNLYRYSPFTFTHQDLDRLHGDNERIGHRDIQRALNFYFHLIVNSQLDHLPHANQNTEL